MMTRRVSFLGLWALIAMAQIQRMPRHQMQPIEPTPPGKGAIEGTVVGSGGQDPLKKAQVTLSGAINPQLTAVTDASGRFAFHDLPPGSYWLNATRQGYNPRQSLFSGNPSVGITLGDGEEKKDVSITLLQGGSISGRVTNDEGAGVRGCGVSAVEPAYEQGRAVYRPAGGVSTDDKGEYHIENLGQGRYSVFAHCYALLPMAHPLLPRGDPRTPHETYLPQFYGGAAASANRYSGRRIDFLKLCFHTLSTGR